MTSVSDLAVDSQLHVMNDDTTLLLNCFYMQSVLLVPFSNALLVICTNGIMEGKTAGFHHIIGKILIFHILSHSLGLFQ